MNPIKQFLSERKKYVRDLNGDERLRRAAREFMRISAAKKYPYNFDWLGRPIMQYPQDIVAMQEILWRVKPDLVIETGIAHGGSLIFYASILELIGKGRVLGIDIDIRPHNKKAISKHPLSKRITMLEGSSTDPVIVKQVKKIAQGKKRILVCLDSDHTGSHVLKELELYAPLVSKNSYLVVFDTVLAHLPESVMSSRNWSTSNNPMTAVKTFLKKNKNFVADRSIEDKLLITVAPRGFLKRIN